jgi:hypothetical protein
MAGEFPARTLMRTVPQGQSRGDSGLCLAHPGASTANGAPLVQVACTTAAADTWGITT